MRNRARRGLSLIELSVVVGVIGVMTSGLWSLASHYRETARQVDLTSELMAVVRNMRAFYGSKAAIDTTNAADIMKSTGSVWNSVIPSAFISGSIVRTPWTDSNNPATNPVDATFTHQLYVCGWLNSTSMKHCNLSAMGATANTPLFAVEMLLPDKTSCIGALLRNSGQSLPGLVDISINDYLVIGSGTNLPVSLTLADSKCGGYAAGTSVNVVDFIYKLVP